MLLSDLEVRSEFDSETRPTRVVGLVALLLASVGLGIPYVYEEHPWGLAFAGALGATFVQSVYTAKKLLESLGHLTFQGILDDLGTVASRYDPDSINWTEEQSRGWNDQGRVRNLERAVEYFRTIRDRDDIV